MARAAGAVVWLPRGRGEVVRCTEEGRQERIGGIGTLGEVVRRKLENLL